MNNSVAFSTFTILCNRHLYRVPKHNHLPKQNPVSMKQLFPIPFPSQPLRTPSLLSVSIDSPILDIFLSVESYNMWPLYLAYFTQYNISKIHPYCSMNQNFISFHGWIIFHCMDGPHLFIHSFLDGHLGCFHHLALFVCLFLTLQTLSGVYGYALHLAGFFFVNLLCLNTLASPWKEQLEV